MIFTHLSLGIKFSDSAVHVARLREDFGNVVINTLQDDTRGAEDYDMLSPLGDNSVPNRVVHKLLYRRKYSTLKQTDRYYKIKYMNAPAASLCKSFQNSITGR
jgi:hypothetical protein